jgi:hypothetical protein
MAFYTISTIANGSRPNPRDHPEKSRNPVAKPAPGLCGSNDFIR